MKIKIKTMVKFYILLIFCIGITFKNYALTNLDLNGVKKSSFNDAPSGAEFYSFNKKGDTGFLSTHMDLNNCTLRFYYVNKDQKKMPKL